jgi:RecB family exonuclease
MVIARMLRHINVYFNALGDREKRFRELLKKSLNETISEGEQKELEELEFSRVATTFAFEQTQQEMPDRFDEVLEQITKLKEMISDLQDNPEG